MAEPHQDAPAVRKKPGTLRRILGKSLFVLLAVELVAVGSLRAGLGGWSTLKMIAGLLLLLFVCELVLGAIRYRFQFTLRTLLILTTVTGAASAWLGYEVRKPTTEPEPWPYRGFRAEFGADGRAIAMWGTGRERYSGPGFFLEHVDVVVDRDLASLKNCDNLRELWLFQTDITDAGLAVLDNLTNLEHLQLAETAVTDRGLAYIEGLEDLKWLDLGATKITDAGLVHLSKMHHLEHLCLEDTGISDAGVEHLLGLSNLELLDLRGTRVTDEGVKKLQQALPDCTIER